MPRYPHKYSANRQNGTNNIIFFKDQKWSDVTRNFWNYSESIPLTFSFQSIHREDMTFSHLFSNYNSCWNPLLYFINGSESHDCWIGEGKDIRRFACIWVSLPTQLGEDCEPWRGECLAFRSHSIGNIKKIQNHTKSCSYIQTYVCMLTCIYINLSYFSIKLKPLKFHFKLW